MRQHLVALAAALGSFTVQGYALPYHVQRDHDNRRAHRARVGNPSKRPSRREPHSAPSFVAICRRADGTGRRYFTCRTHDQALQHGPYLIEHVNGWGQVTRRERFTTEARDAA